MKDQQRKCELLTMLMAVCILVIKPIVNDSIMEVGSESAQTVFSLLTFIAN